jgi:ribonuclease HII
LKREAILKRRYRKRDAYEQRAREEGYSFIAGIDEIGRGSLVGSVVAAAVILPSDCQILDLEDSKILTKNKREEVYEVILEKSVSIGIGSVDSDSLNKK